MESLAGSKTDPRSSALRAYLVYIRSGSRCPWAWRVVWAANMVGDVMSIILSSTLSESISRLTATEQVAAKLTVYEFQVNPASPGLKFHRVEGARDPGFWSARVNSDLRLIIHRAGESNVVCYVGHHDDAYRWAERRKIEVHPQTGAAQLVVFDERVEEVVKRVVRTVQEAPPAFAGADAGYLRSLGVPAELVQRVMQVRRDQLEMLIDVLPEEAMERLLDLADGRPVSVPIPTGGPDPFRHPDAARRFRVVDSADEVRQALEAGWHKWIVFLHPDQRALASKSWSGPLKVGGAAGTGKTVVALHRARYLLSADSEAQVLLTTYSRTLAARLEQHARLLIPEGSSDDRRLSVVNIHRLARDLWTELRGTSPRIADDRAVQAAVERAIGTSAVCGFTPAFVRSEWAAVIDPLDLRSRDGWLSAPRAGRGTALTRKQREALWPVLDGIRHSLATAGLLTWDQLFNGVADLVAQHPGTRYDHVVADEVQDFGFSGLRLLRALVTPGRDDLFLAGDDGQTIFRGRSALAQAGIDIRGRSPRLKVNYRTTGQIQRYADRILAPTLVTAEGEPQGRATVAILAGPQPDLRGCIDEAGEVQALEAWARGLVMEGFRHRDIAFFARTEAVLDRARKALTAAGLAWAELRDEEALDEERVSLGTMHRAKGLEFRAVAVVGCEEAFLPLPAALKDATDALEREETVDRERRLYYVACTRARERLFVTWTGKRSPLVHEEGGPA